MSSYLLLPLTSPRQADAFVLVPVADVVLLVVQNVGLSAERLLALLTAQHVRLVVAEEVSSIVHNSTDDSRRLTGDARQDRQENQSLHIEEGGRRVSE